MATRSERQHSEEIKRGPRRSARTSKKKPKKSEWSHDKAHAGAKATRALETVARGTRPSRESTRRSANHAKADAPMNITQEARKGSPANRARRSLAKTVKVRGTGARR
jgi:hypothetical protein